MSIVLEGSTSGSITLQEPAIAGSNTINLPAATGTMALLQTPSFATTIGVGGATPSTSGAGITFPATQSASTDANTLDDYEEGTWTPGFSFGGGTTGITYSTQYGTYTKIGNTVRVTGYVQMSNKGSSTGVMRVTGLPFINNSNARGYSMQPPWLNNTLSGLNGVVGCYVEPNTTGIFYEKLSGGFFGNFQQITDTMATNTTDAMISFVYQVA